MHATFVLPDDLALPRALQAEPAGPAQRSERVLLDTFDGRLYAAGLVLARDAQRFVLLDGAGAELAAADAPARTARRLFLEDLDAGPLRERLDPVVEMRALLPLARVRGRRRPLRVLDGERKTVVRLEVEEASSDGTALAPRLHVRGVRGYDKAYAAALGAARKLEPEPRSLVADAIANAGTPPEGVSSKPGVVLERGEPGGVAAARICRRLLEVIEATLPGTLADTDTEFLHDLRVAVRRTRAVQRELAGVFDPATLAHFRAEFKWLQQVTGPTRDLDVYVLDFGLFLDALPVDRRDDLEALRDLLVRRRASERRKLVRALRSARCTALLSEWAAALVAPDGPDAGVRVERLAAARITKVYGRMAKDGLAIDDDTPAEALHELRKKGKELRYLLEFFGGLFAKDVTKPMVSTLKALQDVLGRHQDREVQAQLIAELGDAVEAPRTLMTMGMLVERLEDGQAAARAEFADSFAAFAAKGQRKLVRKTFAP